MIGVASILAPINPDRSLKLLRDTEDHERKMFWAFWGPGASRSTKTDIQQIPEFQLIASRLHDTRMAATYVTLDAALAPPDSVTPEFVRSTLELLKVQIELSRPTKRRAMSEEDGALFAWFIGASEDPERAKLVFGASSIAKRSELGNPEAWIRWLKEQFDEADRSARELTARELARKPSAGGADEKPRWRIRLRLESASHSIRSKAFDKWNVASAMVKLSADRNDKEKRSLFVEMDLPTSIAAGSIWHAGLEFSYHLIVALNIGSFGFFWWRLAPRTTRYYEKITDFENPTSELVVEPVGTPRLSYGPNAFTEREMDSVTRAYIGLIQIERDKWQAILSSYLDGLRIAAKVDIHLRVEASALAAFARAFRETVLKVREPGETPAVVAEKLVTMFKLADGDPARAERIATWATSADPATFQESGITLRDVMVVKTLADAALLEASEVGLRQLAAREADRKVSAKSTEVAKPPNEGAG
jgi:hypothetical protein